MTTAVVFEGIYDRSKEVKDFDDSKLGVKGLLDSGITSIPRFFFHPPESLPSITTSTQLISNYEIPTVDLARIGTNHRTFIVDQIYKASCTWGFFQVINHNVPLDVLNRALLSIKAFNEQSNEVKSQYYCRENDRGMTFASNFDLFQSKAASWRDTLQMGMDRTDFDKVPEIVRSELFELDQHVKRLGETFMEILCEGLGVERDSVEHRVTANSLHQPRISVAIFFNPGNLEIMYGPLPELITPPQKSAVYKQFTLEDFIMKFRAKGLDGKSSLVDYFLL
ncbi:hypothetical protein MKW92_024913 [Papaver armeniacum]|nr:hypothetical protein MKW92_024913 [Papaver armeniacum]